MARKLTDEERANLEQITNALCSVLLPSQKNKAASVASALVRVRGDVITQEDLDRILTRCGKDRPAIYDAVLSEALDLVDGEDGTYTLRVLAAPVTDGVEPEGHKSDDNKHVAHEPESYEPNSHGPEANGASTAKAGASDFEANPVEITSAGASATDMAAEVSAAQTAGSEATAANASPSHHRARNHSKSNPDHDSAAQPGSGSLSNENPATQNPETQNLAHEKTEADSQNNVEGDASAKPRRRRTRSRSARTGEKRHSSRTASAKSAPESANPDVEASEARLSGEVASAGVAEADVAKAGKVDAKSSGSGASERKSFEGKPAGVKPFEQTPSELNSSKQKPSDHNPTESESSNVGPADRYSADEASSFDEEELSIEDASAEIVAESARGVASDSNGEMIAEAEVSTSEDATAEASETADSDSAQQPDAQNKSAKQPGRNRGRNVGRTRRRRSKHDPNAAPATPTKLSEVPYVRRGGPAEMEERAKILELDQRFWMNGWLLSHPGAYTLYERELVAINDALVNGAFPGDITRRQLAYQMGGDEKFFEYGAEGHKLLRAMGMEDVVRHRPMPKPDLLYHAPRRRKHMRVLVTENLDPWLDVHDLMYEEGRTSILGERIHAVVLGGGTPILEHNRLALLLDSLGADSVEVLYWGDIDRAGIDILLRLREELAERCPVTAFTPAYQLMVDRAMERYPDPADNERTTQANLSMPDMAAVCDGLTDEAAEYARAVVEGCRLVPQEILTRRDL